MPVNFVKKPPPKVSNVFPPKKKKQKATSKAKVTLNTANIKIPTFDDLPDQQVITDVQPKSRERVFPTPDTTRQFSRLKALPKDAKGIPLPKKQQPPFAREELDDILEVDNLGVDDGPDPFLPEDERKGSTGRLRSTKEGTDFRRKQVHRLLLRGVPRLSIANHLGVGIETIHSDAKIITSEMRRELQEMDYTVYISQSVAFFDECRVVALRLATDNKEKNNGVKMTALRTALEAEKAKNDFFQKVGLFKMVAPTDPFHGINTGRQGTYSDENDLNSFMQLIAKAATGEVVITLPAPDQPAPTGFDDNES